MGTESHARVSEEPTVTHSTLTAVVATLAVLTGVATLPSSASAAVCADYTTQAAAQRAADTRDADGDGVYCESLPCPCLRPGGTSPPPPPPPPTAKRRASCLKTNQVQRIGFSGTKYPRIRAHYVAAVNDGWPRILIVNRRGADARRDRLLMESDLGTMPNLDRDEYPPAVGRGRGRRALRRGVNPVGWMASVRYVPSSENRSHGSRLGTKLRRFCDGQKFRYVFY
ncbi:MAG: hypothetical protein JWN65_4204 [Solirubrobacterales bacterium]|nr:hypothetical protein [Solirubrobacterales bacterium]